MTDLKDSEVESAHFALEVFGADHKLDASLLNKFIYCMNLNPSLETLKKYGLAEKEGVKEFTLEELLPIVSELKKQVKDFGCYEDFIECLKLYDKNENGQMPAGELSHSLLALGEKLTDVEVDELFELCLDEEDDEGDIPYVPFLQRMCEKAPPLKPAKPAPAAAPAKK